MSSFVFFSVTAISKPFLSCELKRSKLNPGATQCFKHSLRKLCVGEFYSSTNSLKEGVLE